MWGRWRGGGEGEGWVGQGVGGWVGGGGRAGGGGGGVGEIKHFVPLPNAIYNI